MTLVHTTTRRCLWQWGTHIEEYLEHDSDSSSDLGDFVFTYGHDAPDYADGELLLPPPPQPRQYGQGYENEALDQSDELNHSTITPGSYVPSKPSDKMMGPRAQVLLDRGSSNPNHPNLPPRYQPPPEYAIRGRLPSDPSPHVQTGSMPTTPRTPSGERRARAPPGPGTVGAHGDLRNLCNKMYVRENRDGHSMYPPNQTPYSPNMVPKNNQPPPQGHQGNHQGNHYQGSGPYILQQRTSPMGQSSSATQSHNSSQGSSGHSPADAPPKPPHTPAYTAYHKDPKSQDIYQRLKPQGSSNSNTLRYGQSDSMSDMVNNNQSLETPKRPATPGQGHGVSSPKIPPKMSQEGNRASLKTAPHEQGSSPYERLQNAPNNTSTPKQPPNYWHQRNQQSQQPQPQRPQSGAPTSLTQAMEMMNLGKPSPINSNVPPGLRSPTKYMETSSKQSDNYMDSVTASRIAQESKMHQNTPVTNESSAWDDSIFNDGKYASSVSSSRSVTPPLPPLSPSNTPPLTPPESPMQDRKFEKPREGIRHLATRTPDVVTSTGKKGAHTPGKKRVKRHSSGSYGYPAVRTWDGRGRKNVHPARYPAYNRPASGNRISVQNGDNTYDSEIDSDSGDMDTTTNASNGEDNDTGNDLDRREMKVVRQQLEGLETMYHEILKLLGVDKEYIPGSRRSISSCSSISRPGRRFRGGSAHKNKKELKQINKRFQRLESHVVTLARSVAHLSSEMRSQTAMNSELQEVKREIHELQEQMRTQGRPKMLHELNDFERFRGWVPSLTNPKRVNKLTKFFGQEPPLLGIFLKKLGYEKYVTNFESERIGMVELPYMNEERLQRIGIPMGPRLRILQEAQLCFRQENFNIYIV